MTGVGGIWLIIPLLAASTCLATPTDETSTDTDGDTSRKVLGSSVVTSVSVIMDTGNGTKAVFTDAVGKPVSKPINGADLASPINLLNPDRYEFYTFDDSGDLVKRLMTLQEIQGIVATGETDGLGLDPFSDLLPEKRVDDVVNNVQNVLKEEMEAHKMPDSKPIFDTPDVSDSWSMILPAIFGNSGEDIKAEKPVTSSPPDTVMLEPTEPSSSKVSKPKPQLQPTYSTKVYQPLTSQAMTPQQSSTVTIGQSVPITMTKVAITGQQLSTTEKIMTLKPSSNGAVITGKPSISSTVVQTEPNTINVEIITNSNSTEKYHMAVKENAKEKIKPMYYSSSTEQPILFSSIRPLYPSSSKPLVSSSEQSSTKRPIVTRSTTSRITDTSKATTSKPVSSPSTVYVLITKTPLTTELLSKITAQSNAKNPTTAKPIFVKKPSTVKPSIAASTTTQAPFDNQSTFKDESSQPTQHFQTTTQSQKSTTNLMPDIISQITSQLLQPGPTAPTMDKFPINSEQNQESSAVYYAPSTLGQYLMAFTKTPINSQTSSLPTLSELIKDTHAEDKNSITSTTTYVSSFTSVPKREPSSEKYQLIKTSKTPLTIEERTNPTTLLDESTEDLNTEHSQAITSQDAEFKTTEKLLENRETETTILDQLLLTSTNIYEINSELSETSTVDTNHESENIFTTNAIPETTQKNSPNTTEPYVITTADTTLIHSIEQLLSQAVGGIEETIVDQINTTRIEQMTKDTDRMNMTDFIKESATIASSLIDSNNVEITTQQISNDSNILNEAVESLLSQVYGSDSQLTTIEDFITTVRPTVSESKYSTTFLREENNPSTIVEESTTNTFEQMETTESSTINQFSDQTTHIINITIISPKPAKSDLSQEQSIHNSSEHLNKKDTTASQPKREDFEILNSTTELEDLNTITTTNPEMSTFEEKSTTLQEQEKIASPIITTTTTTQTPKPSIEITIEEKRNKPKTNSTWTLVSTLAPHQQSPTATPKTTLSPIIEPPKPVDLVPKPIEGFGLEDSTSRLDNDIYQFVQLCNELAFGFWKSVTTKISAARSVIVSPFAATSLLAMVFLGARGATSGEMNEILRLDDMVTFNPHLIFKNVSESIVVGPDSGIATSVLVRELYSDRSKGKILDFYKERVRQFYDGHVEEVSFREIGDIIRRRTNLLVKKQSNGAIPEYIKDNSIKVRAPLAGISANVFETDCSHASTTDRDGELHFVVLPSIRQRRLVPVPAVVYRSGFLAGYEPSLDATAVSIGTKDQTISIIFIIPGQQGIAAPGDGLARLEKRLVESSFKKGAWSRLLRTLIARPGLEVQLPRFSHRSIINSTLALKNMGLRDLFDVDKADLRGLNGVAHELHLSDMLQINTFALCGETKKSDVLHSEIYPATAARSFRRARIPRTGSKSLRQGRNLEHYRSDDVPFFTPDNLDEPRDYQRAFHDPLHNPSYLELPLALRPRQARIPEVPRLRFDRPFLYFVRHNPTGLILHMGRFNPRLLP